MQATKQQQIMGFFIEEAREHLDTIEQGLLDLQATMADSERLNELFRAAHSVKGGAAMLGFDSIHQVAHHLEDHFKTLKDNAIQPDRPLEDLFLKGFDTLKDLVELLQSPYGFQPAQAEQLVQTAQPVFQELETYLENLLKGGTAAPAVKTMPNAAAILMAALKKMLLLFKQGDSAAGRQQLGALCGKLKQLSTSQEWHELLDTTQGAIARSANSYQTLAPVIIKEMKQAGALLTTNRSTEIIPSRELQTLAQRVSTPAKPAAPKPVAPPPPVVAPVSAPSQAPEVVMVGNRAQVMVPLEPRAAARVLLDAFNKAQLIELAEFLMKAIQ